MNKLFKIAGFFFLLPVIGFAQQKEVISLAQIIQKIDSNNILLQSYSLKAEGYKYSADAATAWMPPMVGVGTFMTPYPLQKIMDDRDKGSLMLRLEQEIPNRSKLQAKKAYTSRKAILKMQHEI